MKDDQTKDGRPVDYTTEIGRTICKRLVDGEGLRAICADAGMPDQATVHRWLARHKEFRKQYSFAREFQADDLFDQILEIVDDSSGDRVEKVRANGQVVIVPDRNHLARGWLRSEVREWVLVRLAPPGNGEPPKAD